MTTKPLYWIERAGAEELWVASTIADLVAGLIPGYASMDTIQQNASRRSYATTVAQAVQQDLFRQAIANHQIDLSDIPDNAMDRVLGEGSPDERAPWELDAIPLIVVGGPSSEWRPPAGKVIVVDARRDGGLLLSLAVLGEIRSLGLITDRARLKHPLGF